MPPKKKADDRPAIFAAIDKGDDDAVQEMLSADPGLLNLRNKVQIGRMNGRRRDSARPYDTMICHDGLDGWTPLQSSAYLGTIDSVMLTIKPCTYCQSERMVLQTH